MTATAMPVLQGTPAWIDARLDYVTASDLPILTGNSPYRSSPFDLWCAKTRRLPATPVDPLTQEMYDLGHALEPVIAERYALMRGRPLRRVNRFLVSKTVPWAAASLDRVSAVRGERLIVELKWVPWRRWVEGPEPVPAYVQDQVQWQLLVTGYEAAEVAVLNGAHVDVHEVMPDRAYQEALLVIAGDFRVNHILAEVPPELDGSEATRKALARLYPSDDGSLMEPTAELEALMREWREARPAVEVAKEREDRIKNAIRGALGEHAGAEGNGWKVTHRLTKGRTTTDWQAVAHVMYSLAGVPPETYDGEVARHTTTTEGARSLRPTWRDEGEGPWT
jgi:putative phage-type endonuclease